MVFFPRLPFENFVERCHIRSGVLIEFPVKIENTKRFPQLDYISKVLVNFLLVL